MKDIIDTGKVLLAIQAFDNRSITEESTRLWHDMLLPYTLVDCMEAVKSHYAQSEKWLMPIDIIRRVKSIRQRRLDLIGAIRLHPADELTKDGSQRADAKHKLDYLKKLIADGTITKAHYDAYMSADLALTDIGRISREITA